MLIYKGQNVSVGGDCIKDRATGEVIARATTWEEGPGDTLVAIAFDDEAGRFIAEHTDGEWDGQFIHASGCTCDWCTQEVGGE